MTYATISWKRTVLVLFLTFCIWWSLQWISPVYAGEQDNVATHTVLVKFAADTDEMVRDAVIEQMDAELVRWIAPLFTAEVRMRSNGDNLTAAAMSDVTQSESVISIQVNGLVSGVPIEMANTLESDPAGQSTVPPMAVQVNDPDFNDPQRVYAPQLLEVSYAWQYTMGAPSIIVAVVDSGVNNAHPDLVGRILDGYDYVNDDEEPLDDHGHGTHIAGLIAANANNGIGSAGICPFCSILPVKVLNASNVGTWSDVASGIVYAVDHGAQVINLSLGGTSNPPVVQDAIDYATANNVLIVAAAGNSRTDTPFYPAAVEQVIAVSATRQDDTRWTLSNFGEWVDISAPGYTIYSTYYDLNNYYNGYIYMSGTSMAAPHVAGVAALLLSQNPERTPDDLRRVLLETADDLGLPGIDVEFGAGRLNAKQALMLEAPQPAQDAALSGAIWQDQNENGAWDDAEAAGGLDLTIIITDQEDSVVRQLEVNGSSEWCVEDLFPGRYTVHAQPNARTVVTTNQEYEVVLLESQILAGLDFGIAEIEEDISL
ncbi:MAG: peptidase S8, partial [Caldilineaceae bacterium]|nr:peptidase S8 [Caldilineaceae bacterium]